MTIAPRRAPPQLADAFGERPFPEVDRLFPEPGLPRVSGGDWGAAPPRADGAPQGEHDQLDQREVHAKPPRVRRRAGRVGGHRADGGGLARKYRCTEKQKSQRGKKAYEGRCDEALRRPLRHRRVDLPSNVCEGVINAA
eukprot:9278136-Pyramimonas_sp.AAC.1